MGDPGLERYVAGIEEHLGRRLGRERVLSPPDFELARRWFAGGVPLGDVIEAIDALVAEGRAPTSLAGCRRRVEARTPRGPRAPAARPATARPVTAATAPPARHGALRLARALEALPGERRCHFDRLRARLADLERATGGLDPAERAALAEALAGAARAALSGVERAALEAEVERATARQRGRVRPEVLERARQRELARRALALLRLPPLE